MMSSLYPRTSLPALVLTGLLSTAQANDKPIADVQLNTDINRMSVQLSQDTYWHCKIDGGFLAEGNEDGSMKMNPDGSIPGVEFGSGKKTCELRPRPRRAGLLDTLIASVQGTHGGPNLFVGNGRPRVSALMAAGWGNKFGLTMDRSDAKLRCVYGHSWNSGHGESHESDSWASGVLAPGQSVDAGHAGHCLLSDGGNSATLRGNCDWTSGGDADACMARSYEVRVLKSTVCVATVEIKIRHLGTILPATVSRHRYKLCG